VLTDGLRFFFAGRQLVTVPTGRSVSTENGQLLGQCHRKHRDDLFTFLHRPDVPADNNASERALHKSVVHRNVSGSLHIRIAPQEIYGFLDIGFGIVTHLAFNGEVAVVA